jgi:exodeoxyribonuclease-5
MAISLSAQQEKARTAFLRWYHDSNKSRPFFYLQGVAGGGKSTVTTAITDSISGEICNLAPTAKSALVMRAKGCLNPRTIHSALYKPKGLSGNKEQINLLYKLTKLGPLDAAAITIRAKLGPELLRESVSLQEFHEKSIIEAKTKGHSVPEVPQRLLAIRKALRDNIASPKDLIETKPLFELKEETPVREAALIVLDECSMIGSKIFEDILSLNVPVLALGDKFQLPPVMAQSFFVKTQPDYELTEIHRQAKDSPIIHLATLAREGKTITPGQYGNCLVTRESLQDEAMAADQILIGTHETRHRINALYRKLKGYTSQFPEVGERLICKHNDNKLNFLNGEQYTVTSINELQDELRIGLQDDEGNYRGIVSAHKEYFLKDDKGKQKEPNPYTKHKKICLDTAAAGTIHSAQGSQWPFVYMVDESRKFGADASKHRYTGITRAANKLVMRVP